MPAILEPVTLAIHLQDIHVVGETIQQCPGEPLRVKHRGSLVEGQVGGHQDGAALVALSRVNYICRLASISFAGSPPWPGPVAGQRWSGSWGRQTPG